MFYLKVTQINIKWFICNNQSFACVIYLKIPSIVALQITQLDAHLKLEMKNKESFEKELNSLNQISDATEAMSASASAPMSVSVPASVAKRKADIKTVEGKIVKSTEKLDAMRLLMLQYCTALQVSINAPEQDDDGHHMTESSMPMPTSLSSMPSHLPQGQSSAQTSNQGQGSRVSYMGGFVKRASSSVKEKMSLIRKDFGKKGTGKPQTTSIPISTEMNLLSGPASKSTSMPAEEIRNNRRLASFWDGLSSRGGRMFNRDAKLDGIGESSSERDTSDMDDTDTELNKRAGHQRHNSSPAVNITTNIGRGGIPSTSDEQQLSSSLPRIRVNFGEDFDPNHFADSTELKKNENKNENFSDTNNKRSTLHRGDSLITRSNSDSHLEINKMVALNPDDVLRYNGNSLPKLLVSEDDNSESDYIVIDSSDEEELSDFYEDDRYSNYGDLVRREDSPSLNLMPEMIIGGRLPPIPGSNGSDVGSKGATDSPDDDEEEDNGTAEHRLLTQDHNSYVV